MGGGDFSDPKKGIGSVYPEHAIDSASGLNRVEPLITASVFKRRFFGGIPMTWPRTKEKITNADLKDYIHRGINQFELDSQLDVTQVVRRHKLPFDVNQFTSYMYFEVPNKPITQINKLAIAGASYKGDTIQESKQYPEGSIIYIIPSDWIEMANTLRGIVNVVPLNPAFSSVGGYQIATGGSLGASLLNFLGGVGFIPAFWIIEAVHGFCSNDGTVPIGINEGCGMAAALLLLRDLIPQYAVTSASLGLDGLSQGVGDQTYQVLAQRIELLEKQYDKLIRRLKTLTSNTIFSTHI